MRRLLYFTLPAFILAMSLLSAPVAMSVLPKPNHPGEDRVEGSEQIGDNSNVIMYGMAWIGRFRYGSSNDNKKASIYAEHDYYAHHYSTEAKVNYSVTFKLQVKEFPAYIDEHGLNGQMDKYDLDDAMPQNYIGHLTYTYVDVTPLPRLPLGDAYTAHGYTRLDLTNPDGDDLELKAKYEWPFHH